MEYANPWNVESVEVFGLAVIFGFSLLTANIVLIALTAVIIAVFHHHTTPRREARSEDHEFII
ncbi:MAG: hypothetical protein QXR53_00340 [Candidatus Norongarragalinales archaeon]